MSNPQPPQGGQMPGGPMPVPGQDPAGHGTPPPAPHGYQQMPQGQPLPPAKPKKPFFKRVWFWILVVLVVVIGGCSAALAGGGDTDTGSAAEAPAEDGTDAQAAAAEDGDAAPAEGAAADDGAAAEEDADSAEAAEDESASSAVVGDPVEVGDWTITVTGIEDGISSVGNEYFGEEAQGQYVKVGLEVTNNGSSAEYFSDSAVTLLDADGNEYSSSTDSMYLEEGAVIFDEINPGNTLDGTALYDVPEGVEITTISISDGFFGSPVEVAVG
ncbi:DUF4352 domain-containing protein [Brevibacterium litoralis]|uniref:DUF4352 domain-containing protein n=1 Tax=Brevibacterium litoralis TaxID=3138935 RepID=UPI0032F0095A